MKRNVLGKIFTLVAATSFIYDMNAQGGNENVREKITDERGKPSFVIFKETSSYKSSDAQKVFKEQLGMKDNSALSLIKSEKDKHGYTHEKYQLFHQGIKVEFSTYSLHSKSGKLESMSGEFYQINAVNTRPSISKEQALSLAMKQIGASSYLWESAEEARAMDYQKPTGELVILPLLEDEDNGKRTERFRLAYKFDIYATNPVSRGDMYIDAVNGDVLFYNATIKHLEEFSNVPQPSILEKTNSSVSTLLLAANADTRYSGTKSIETSLSGSSYILSDTTRGIGGILTLNMKKGTNYAAAVNFTDADNIWTASEYNNANKDNGALDAHWGAEKTYDYWSTVHGRNSFDGAGAAIKSYVHYSTNYNNAYWNGSVMTYGDGSGTGGFNVLTSIDVAAHEIGHAICSKEANLAYQLESGALNEAFSDIWAACVEHYTAPNEQDNKQIWLIGEEIEMRAGHIALRSMSNPKAEGQPDTYGGTNWVNQTKCRPSSRNDYCGVHKNSGVLNHWFYILTEGKAGTNDKGNAYNVTGIGIDKAAKIAYRMESVHLTPNSTYASARTYGIQAATEIFGADTPEVVATTNAFYAVGVGAAYVSPTGKMDSSFASPAKTADDVFVLYPNPASATLTISVLENKEGEYKVFNAVGAEVLNGKTLGGEINVSELNKGIYFFKFNDGENTFVKTFIKN